MYKVVIGSSNCENIGFEEAIKKLGLATERHPYPYKLSWLKKVNEVTVFKRCLVSFSIRSKYKASVWCNVMTTDGTPW